MNELCRVCSGPLYTRRRYTGVQWHPHLETSGTATTDRYEVEIEGYCPYHGTMRVWREWRTISPSRLNMTSAT